jgi:isoquinoline 1-oxidoreductase beta subunit
MSIQKVNRRDFFKLSGRTGGGLVLGATALSSASQVFAGTPFPIAPGTPSDALALNLFVQIETDDNVYIVCHRSEMGQGAKTGVPQVIADELDADWNKVTIVQAQGNAAYGDQNTDGSTSIRKRYGDLRFIGASARYMLEHAAAKKWGIDAELCKVDLHRVVRRDTGESLRFGELAELAATMPQPSANEVKLKSPSEFRYIGKPLELVDMNDIIGGTTVYGADKQLPGMVYASTEHCPYLGGVVKKVDDSAARKVAGVLDVVIIEPNGGKALPAAFNPMPGVAVIASNTWAAFKGREALKIEWSESEHASYDSKKQLQEMQAALDGQTLKIERKKGDVIAAFAAAADTFEASYSVPYYSHAQMEPLACLAHVQAKQIEVWACTQAPQSTQRELAGRLGFKPEDVQVNVTLLGGAFGRKSKPDFIVEAALISQKVGKPVRLQWSREDDMRTGYYHAQSALKIRVAMDKTQKVSAWHGTACYPSISSLWQPENEHPAAWEPEIGFTNTPFDIANEQIDTAPSKAHTRIGWMRSVCNIQQAFAISSFVDELARHNKKDTVTMWQELIGKDRNIRYDDHGYKLGNYQQSLDDYPYESKRLKNVLQLVERKSHMNKKVAKNEGWGIACHYSFLSHVAVASRVKIDGKKLSVEEVHIAVDCGLAVNPDRVKAQMEGAVIFGISAALMGEITFANGRVEQSNYHDYPVARIHQSPEIHVHIVENQGVPRGVGEPGVPPAAPSLANAIVAAGGERIRHLPINKVYQV